jgi:uncharacterized membrane protein
MFIFFIKESYPMLTDYRIWLAILAFFSPLMLSPWTPALAGPKTAAAAPTEITFPTAQFADGKARHYSLSAPGGITIKYFIIRSSDGVIRTAFDACDVCWASGKGYQQDGDAMICRNCGKRFASKLVNEAKGGCNPAPLKRTVKGDTLVIQTKDILEGRHYFNF